MSPDQLEADLTAALADRQMLTHPFYRRWDAGTLQPGELGAYAGQYRHFEAALPGILRALLTQLEPGRAADLVQGNLADEESNPEPHVDVLAAFADSVGSSDAPASPATLGLLAAYRWLIEFERRGRTRRGDRVRDAGAGDRGVEGERPAPALRAR